MACGIFYRAFIDSIPGKAYSTIEAVSKPKPNKIKFCKRTFMSESADTGWCLPAIASHSGEAGRDA